MAKDASFDIVSEFDKQELVNAVDQVKRELTTRFDLKDSNSNIEIIEDKSINITTNDEMKLRNIFDDYISMNIDNLMQKYNTKIQEEWFDEIFW